MLKPSLQLRLGQQLTMTPQLQQAIRLLQLPVMDLQTQIEEALESNIMLETEELAEPGVTEKSEQADEAAVDEAAPEVEARDETEWQESQTVGPSDTPYSGGPREDFEFADRSGESLQEYLLSQVGLENFDERAAAIARAIIDAINDDGYLMETLEEIQQTLTPDLNATLDEIEATLWMVQKLDPAGVAARDLSECILLQLGQLEPSTPGLELARQIAADHLDLLAEHDYAGLRRRLRASEDELAQAAALVKSSHPRPGSAIYPSAPEYVVPDVFVRRQDGRWVVELNESLAPRLRVNQSYAGMLGKNSNFDTLRAQLQEARWLVRSLEIRNDTLLRVATSIVAEQTAFLEHGEEFMKPLVLKDIAERVDMHESTISRVTMNKYMRTPRGIFEFRYFFSSHVSGEDGDQSAVAVRAKIKKLISQEPPGKPLSDNRIAELLSRDGVQIARRTVAKYREAMHIPSSSERKRMHG